MWTMETALEVVREIEKDLTDTGWHCGLTGSVLYKGASEHDLDLILYPRDKSNEQPRDLVRNALMFQSFYLVRTDKAVQRHWRTIGSNDTKSVEVYFQAKTKRRVDVFFLS